MTGSRLAFSPPDCLASLWLIQSKRGGGVDKVTDTKIIVMQSQLFFSESEISEITCIT